MINNEATVQAIRTECQNALLTWEVLDRAEDFVVVHNPGTKVSVSSKIEREGEIIYSVEYKITDQTSIIRPKKAKAVFYTDGDLYCEYSAFKSEEDILASLKK